MDYPGSLTSGPDIICNAAREMSFSGIFNRAFSKIDGRLGFLKFIREKLQSYTRAGEEKKGKLPALALRYLALIIVIYERVIKLSSTNAPTFVKKKTLHSLSQPLFSQRFSIRLYVQQYNVHLIRDN